MAHAIYISVGSNMGDKLENCRKGITAIADHQEITLVDAAYFYKTAPMDYIAQDWFVNTAIGVAAELSPQTLLQVLQTIQTTAGRTQTTIRFGPRLLDLDIIFFGNEIVESENLTIPHPRMHQRRFVLQPLCDLAPDFVHPVLRVDVKTLLQTLDPDEQPVEGYRMFQI